jgi:hypothetical protein
MTAADPAPHADRFWDDFARDHWERKPAMRRAEPTAIPSARAVFDAVVRCCDPRHGRRLSNLALAANKLGEWVGFHYRPGGIMLRFLIDNRPVLRLDRYLPRASDGSFEGYHDRISAELNRGRPPGRPQRRYACIVNNLEILSPELYQWSRTFIEPLYRAGGMNNLGNYLAVFIGDYHRTAAGVHVDPESNFFFPLAGTKRMRTWPSTYPGIAALSGALEYDRALEGSTLLEARPGGWLYWPSDNWHVAEGDGSLSATLTVGLGHRARGDAARALIPFDPDHIEEAVRRVPDSLDLGWRVGTGPLGAAARRTQWLARATALGFLQVPARRAIRPPSPLAHVRLAAPGALAWVVEDGALLVGASGHVRRVADEPAARCMLAELTGGKRHRVGALVERWGDHALDHVTWLLGAHALVAEGA